MAPSETEQGKTDDQQEMTVAQFLDQQRDTYIEKLRGALDSEFAEVEEEYLQKKKALQKAIADISSRIRSSKSGK